MWVVDAGGIRTPAHEDDPANAFDVGEAVVSRYLWHFWMTRLDRIILSHPDQDHAGGIPALLRNFRVKELDAGLTGSDSGMARIHEAASKNAVPVHATGRGDSALLGEVSVRVLNPAGVAANRGTNDNSVVLHLEFGRFSALLTGDLEASGEADLLSHNGKIESLLLKVSHHGSRNGTGGPVLDAVKPRWAVISAGRNNPFGHPSPDVVSRLLHRRIRTFQTLEEGAISFETDGIHYVVGSHVGGILESGVLPGPGAVHGRI